MLKLKRLNSSKWTIYKGSSKLVSFTNFKTASVAFLKLQGFKY